MTDILIVEDVETMRSLLEEMISGIPGCRVSGTAANVWDARIELGRRRPALVLLDEILPGESSVDLLAEIQALEVPVLLITGIENPSHACLPGLPAGSPNRTGIPSRRTAAAFPDGYSAALKQHYRVDGPLAAC